MSCIKTGNIRCTKCCEAIHIPMSTYTNLRKGVVNYTDGEKVLKLWVKISKRQAKKVNPYMFSSTHPISKTGQREYLRKAAFFKCSALIDGVCTVYEDRPNVCKIYTGGFDYSYTCVEDIKIIARSVD